MKFSQYKYERSSYENIIDDFTKLVDPKTVTNNLLIFSPRKSMFSYILADNFIIFVRIL